MYERMLNKQEQPTFGQMIAFCGEAGSLLLELDAHLVSELALDKLIRYPYGKEYGWGVKYSRKSKHICDVFAENGAVTALFQVSEKAIDTVFSDLGECAKQVWENKNPCKGGGWIEFRVINQEQLQDLEIIIHAKATVRTK